MDDRESHFKMKMNKYTLGYQVSNIRYLYKPRPRARTDVDIVRSFRTGCLIPLFLRPCPNEYPNN